MKSVLKKFEKNSIDMSKIYGQGDIGTGRARTATSGGAVLSGMEYIRIYDDGCVWTYLATDGGGIYDVKF